MKHFQCQWVDSVAQTHDFRCAAETEELARAYFRGRIEERMGRRLPDQRIVKEFPLWGDIIVTEVPAPLTRLF